MTKTITLRKKLLVWLLFPMLILLMTSTLLMYYLAFGFVDYAYDYALLDSTDDLGGQIVNKGGRPSLELSESARRMFLSDEFDKIYFNIIDKNGRLVAGDADLPSPANSKKLDFAFRDGSLRGQRVRIASRLFLLRGLPADQYVVIQVAETLNRRKALANRVITALVLPQVLLIVVAAVVVWIGIKKGLEPLDRLRGEISARSHKDLSPVEESNTPEEVRPIIREINELMKRLGKTLDAQQRFVADAAHQLRTPLAGLKTQTALALRQTDPENLRHSLNQINASTDQSIRLVNQMLLLAQVEHVSENLPELKELDLHKIVREVTTEWVPLALKRNVDLGYEGLAHAVAINGDLVSVRMLMDNLLDNAIKYSSDGGKITTRLETCEDSVILTVEDNGVGIPPEERQSVFQRFYRIVDNPVSGSGLGLSIAGEIARAHEARISIEDPEGHQGTSVKVFFPRGVIT